MLHRRRHIVLMGEKEAFQEEIVRFVERQPTKSAAADVLGISRQDLYRYLEGSSVPRLKRRESLLRIMHSPSHVASPLALAAPRAVDVQSVTKIRDMMLHIVSLLDLDLAGRDGEERDATHRKDPAVQVNP